MKTIRQIADEIGVSKQAVYKRYKGKLHTVCAPYAHTEQGVLYLSEQAETLIKQDFLKDNRSNGAHTDTRTERSIGAVLEQSQEAGVVAVLQATIDTLQGQLEVKDRQIEQQTQTITRLTDALLPNRQRQRPRLSMRGRSSSSFFPGRPARSDRVRNQSKSVAGLASCFEVRTAYQIVKEKMMIVLIGGKI